MKNFEDLTQDELNALRKYDTTVTQIAPEGNRVYNIVVQIVRDDGVHPAIYSGITVLAEVMRLIKEATEGVESLMFAMPMNADGQPWTSDMDIAITALRAVGPAPGLLDSAVDVASAQGRVRDALNALAIVWGSVLPFPDSADEATRDKAERQRALTRTIMGLADGGIASMAPANDTVH